MIGIFSITRHTPVVRLARILETFKLRSAGAYPGFSEGGGVPRSVKEANKPNKRATGLKPRTCAPIRGQCLGPTSGCFVESSICTALV